MLERLPQKDSESELEDILMAKGSNFKIIAKTYGCISKIPLAGSLNLLIISSRTPPVSHVGKVKLPKLELPKFDGDIIDCRGFWDQFQVAIHENENIAETGKYTYLKYFLAYSALLAISGLSLNSKVLISAHITQFLQLPKIKSSSDVKGLRNMYDQIEISVRDLKPLDIDIPTYGSLLVPFLNLKGHISRLDMVC